MSAMRGPVRHDGQTHNRLQRMGMHPGDALPVFQFRTPRGGGFPRSCNSMFGRNCG